MQDLCFLDTGQCIDTGQLLEYAESAAREATRLCVTFHEIHKFDASDADKIISTLKYFSLHLAVQDEHGDLQYHLDGTPLLASLVYENGESVEELSATHEPALLSTAGGEPKVVIEGGVAMLRLRITVLSSLCNKRSFCVKVASLAQPELVAVTAPVKTITKLHRGPRESVLQKRAATLAPAPKSALVERAAEPNQLDVVVTGGAKRAFESIDERDGCGFGAVIKCGAVGELDCGAMAGLGGASLDELWEEVASNGARLLELQAQQRKLFKELRALKEADMEAAHGAAPLPLTTAP